MLLLDFIIRALMPTEHEGIILLVFAALCEVGDFAACEGVCRAWRCLLPDCQPHNIIASRQQPLQELIWLAAHRKLMRNLKKFIIKDDIMEEGLELSGLLHLAFKYACGLTDLDLKVPVRDSERLMQIVSCKCHNGDARDTRGIPKDNLDALANVPSTLRVLVCHDGEFTTAQWAMMPQEVQLLATYDRRAESCGARPFVSCQVDICTPHH